MDSREFIDTPTGKIVVPKVVLADPATGQSYKQGGNVDPSGSQQVNTLGRPTVARKIATTGTSQPVTLTTGVLRISMLATGAPIRYNLGAAASPSTHLIAEGERMDIAVTSGAVLHAIQSGAVAGILEISELA